LKKKNGENKQIMEVILEESELEDQYLSRHGQGIFTNRISEEDQNSWLKSSNLY
jgi:hypothetical protein